MENFELSPLLEGSEQQKEFDVDSLLSSRDNSDVIGHGSYGTVRRCFWSMAHYGVVSDSLKSLSLSDSVAVKCMLANNESDVAQLKKEAEILFKLEHENILKMIGSTTWKLHDSGCVFGLILEEIKCKNLADLLRLKQTKVKNKKEMKEFVPIDWKLRFRIFFQIGSGLVYLHDKKLVHMDMKPENILLTDTMCPKLADFGSVQMSRTTRNAVAPKNLQYTMLYAAPEVMRDPINVKPHWSMDVYSYAMIGYEILTRSLVFRPAGASFNVVVDAISTLGQKPNPQPVRDVENELKKEEHLEDYEIFKIMKSSMENCWKHSPNARPKMRDTWKSLAEFAKSENPYEDAIKEHARYLANLQKSAAPQKCLRVSLKSCQQFVNILSSRCGDSKLFGSTISADSNEHTRLDASMAASSILSETKPKPAQACMVKTDSAQNSLDSVVFDIQQIENESSSSVNCRVPQHTPNSSVRVECQSRDARVIERSNRRRKGQWKKNLIAWYQPRKKLCFCSCTFIILLSSLFLLCLIVSDRCSASVRFIYPKYDLYIVPYNDSSNFTIKCEIEKLAFSANIFWRKVTTSGYVVLPFSNTYNPSEYQVFNSNGLGAELVLTNVVSSNFYECAVDVSEKIQEHRRVNTCTTMTEDFTGNISVSSNQTSTCGVPNKTESSTIGCILAIYGVKAMLIFILIDLAVLVIIFFYALIRYNCRRISFFDLFALMD